LLSKRKPVIFGCAGTALTTQEKKFFRHHKPYGFILFKRNIESPDQTERLVAAMRDAVGTHCPILIDQEGGRVARLKPPHWPEFPSMEKLVDGLPLVDAKKRVFENAIVIGKVLTDLGINVDCAPVCDLKMEGAHSIVGDRSFGNDPIQVATLAAVMCDGLRAAGVTPIIKHIPGHGRAKVDSHEDLPKVDTPLDILEKTDFKVFSLLASQDCWAMTAHIVYTALDPTFPATTSPTVIRYIREHIGFKGLLISDDISMKALKGDLGQLSCDALAAGCDIILHCNGHMQEMEVIAEALLRG
jgi:beta-N-acetylhexosaminidase